ncbi:MAG: DUF4434 domain-containing protein [Lentisphaerae bacterium]|nr:DUF4434 domain-containing protein [Lentisphaerota bacterium]
MEKKKFIPLTGTFIDGVASDIPANNWTRAIWKKELREQKALGIDTLVIIRIGYGDTAMYDSPVLKCTLHNSYDLLALILEEAEILDMKVFIGLFDSSKYWLKNDWPKEVDLNKRLMDELEERYLKYKSFYGWYISHEGDIKFHQEKVWKPLAQKMRQDTPDKPIMISPRYAGRKYEPQFAVTPELHAQHFEYLYSEMAGLLDIAAFMDGHVDFNELPDFMAATKEVSDRFGIKFWSNLETFDRDMPWRFPPIEWNKMRCKLEAAQKYVEKIITFEAPHFLSNYSCYPAAARLRECYLEYLEEHGY